MQIVLGIIYNTQGEVLISQRPLHKHKGGFWEFPGGKLEQNESSYDALKRELFEEIGIHIISARFSHTSPYTYSDHSVSLDIWYVTQFEGRAFNKEGQPIAWVHPAALKQFKILEGNQELIHNLHFLSHHA